MNKESIERLKMQVGATITRTLTRALHAEPIVFQHEDGGTTEFHHRFANPEKSRWIQLRDGLFTVVTSTDIAIQTNKSKMVFDHAKVKNNPKNTLVFAEGLSLPKNIVPQIAQSSFDKEIT